jgi:hypothetical protein
MEPASAASTTAGIMPAKVGRNRSSRSVTESADDGSRFGDNDSDDGFGKPDHKFSQLTVLAFETVESLLQLNIPINLIETLRPLLPGSDFLHCPFLWLEAGRRYRYAEIKSR